MSLLYSTTLYIRFLIIIISFNTPTSNSFSLNKSKCDKQTQALEVLKIKQSSNMDWCKYSESTILSTVYNGNESFRLNRHVEKSLDKTDVTKYENDVNVVVSNTEKEILYKLHKEIKPSERKIPYWLDLNQGQENLSQRQKDGHPKRVEVELSSSRSVHLNNCLSDEMNELLPKIIHMNMDKNLQDRIQSGNGHEIFLSILDRCNASTMINFPSREI